MPVAFRTCFVGSVKKRLRNFTPRKILLARTNNLGDLVLTMPVIDAIKQRFPHCEVVLLIQKYTADLKNFFVNLDHVILYEDLLAMDEKQAIYFLQQQQIDCFISLHDVPHILKLIRAARVPIRIANARRLSNWRYCNVLPNISRRNSNLHEVQLNMAFAGSLGIAIPDNLSAMLPQIIPSIKPRCGIAELDEPDARFKLALHPASNQHGREWPESYYVDLIKSLDPNKFQIFITGSLQEKLRLPQLSALEQENVCNIMGRLSVKDWHSFLQQVDGLIAAGTGPLHMAAAMGTRTLGLFPPQKHIGPMRWQPVGAHVSYLMHGEPCAINKCSNIDCACMRAITVAQVQNIILEWLNEK
jgi:heptosyltransferase-3